MPDRATEIKKELEELLALEQAAEDGEGFETLKDERRKSKSKKIQYTRRTDDSKETNDDANSKKSGRSKQSRRSRISKAGSTRITKRPTQESDKKEDLDKSPKPSSESPKPDRKKERRKIKYNRSTEPETPEERDRDARSHRSKDSRGSRIMRRSGHRKPRSGSDHGSETASRSSKPTSYRRRAKSPDSGDENMSKLSSSRRSSSKKEQQKAKSWSDDDFANNGWSSSEDEGDVEIKLNDGEEGEFSLNDGDRKSRSRRRSIRGNSNSVERRRGSQGNMSRSPSSGGLEAKRRHARRGSGGALDGGMILGDPSRRAPPRRTKSNDMSNARFQNGLKRSDSNDFSDYLRKQGLTQKSDRSTARTQYSDPSSLESHEQEEEDDNPFEVTYHQSFHQSFDVNDNWDPFAEDAAGGEKGDDTNDRRGNLRPNRSGGLLATSAKDTISRLSAGANIRKGSGTTTNMDAAIAVASTEELGEREKQRRADYKKSIAAAAMAGRRLSSGGPKPAQRQVRTVRSSFQESMKQLEGALQSAQ